MRHGSYHLLVKLSITHIVGGSIAPYESAVILSVTPITEASRMRDKTSSSEAVWQEEELSAAALPTSVWPSAATVAGSDVSCAGQANPGGLWRLGGGEGGLPLL